MNAVVEARNLTKRYKDVLALDDVSVTLTADRIYGLLGRNGAGKTTLMSIITAQSFASTGQSLVFGEEAYENDAVLRRVCFVRESQRYPDDFAARHAFKAAQLMFANWDQEFADRLVADFGLPLKRRIKKLSRGQLSAVGVIIGLAARAELTFFDEPYLGLDAVARQLFYDHLLADFTDHPRTVVLSSHLIDEVANLLDHVIVLDQGKVLIDAEAEELRGSAATVVGTAAVVDGFTAGMAILHRETLGSVASVTVDQVLTAAQRIEAQSLGLELAPVPLQQLVVRKTTGNSRPQPGLAKRAELDAMEARQ